MADPIFYALNAYAGDGTTREFTVSWSNGYISTADVLAQTTTDLFNYTDLPIESVVGSVVTLVDAPDAGAIVIIKRNTNKTAKLVDYSDGAILNEGNLDLANDQTMNLAIEAFDNAQLVSTLANSAFNTAMAAVSDAQNALNTAIAAQDDAAAALTASAGAVSTANTANANASAALTAASTAYSLASGVDGKAEDALDQSAAALSTAGDAVITANAASAAVGNKLDKSTDDYTFIFNDANGFVLEHGTAGQVFRFSDALNQFNLPLALPLGSTIDGNPIGVSKDLQSQVMTASGAFVIPATNLMVEMVGGGGGGGGGGGVAASATFGGSGGSAGQPGESIKFMLVGLTVGDTLWFVQGAGGGAGTFGIAGGGLGGNGGNGGNSELKVGTASGTLIKAANGGAGGYGGGGASGTTPPTPAGLFGTTDKRSWFPACSVYGGAGEPGQAPQIQLNLGTTTGPVNPGGVPANSNTAGSTPLSGNAVRGAGGPGGGGAGGGGSALAGGGGRGGNAGAIRFTWIG